MHLFFIKDVSFVYFLHLSLDGHTLKAYTTWNKAIGKYSLVTIFKWPYIQGLIYKNRTQEHPFCSYRNAALHDDAFSSV